MKNSSYEVRVIEPDEGKWLTQNSEVSLIKDAESEV